jgi:hypothetical protein
MSEFIHNYSAEDQNHEAVLKDFFNLVLSDQEQDEADDKMKS